MTKTSSINLVDLAGSERADATGKFFILNNNNKKNRYKCSFNFPYKGATGDRLKEGAAINQSLSVLGQFKNLLL